MAAKKTTKEVNGNSENQQTEVKKKTTRKKRVASEKDVKTMKPEEGVLIMACLNPTVAKTSIECAKQNGVKVVILEDKVIYDYLKAEADKQSNKDAISVFLSNESNRGMAKKHQMKLWNILTKGAALEKSKDLYFTRTDVTHLTTLSHSRASEVLQMLNAFGYIEYSDEKCFRFKFVFSDEDIVKRFRDELSSVTDICVASFMKYESAAENICKKSKMELVDEFIEDIRKRI